MFKGLSKNMDLWQNKKVFENLEKFTPINGLRKFFDLCKVKEV